MPNIPRPIAILYQALPPPVIGGLRKDAKPGGYSDSGADIGFCLRTRGLEVLTPVRDANPNVPMEWVFPDTMDGIDAASRAGAAVFWANTVVFEGHPIEKVIGTHWIVGQLPAAQQAADDKFATNTRLRDHGLPVPAALLAAHEARPGVAALASLTENALRNAGFVFPLVVKPVRGRGSQGVTLVKDHAALLAAAKALIASARFGNEIIVEQYLSGDEMTVTVLPKTGGGYWALPPVLRFNHHDGVAPYNGLVAVTQNSRTLTSEEQNATAVITMMAQCVEAAALMNAKAPIRIDCRGDSSGALALFDLNLKPNLTGAGRPGRDDQDSLTTMAAQAIGWSYGDLLEYILKNAWRSA